MNNLKKLYESLNEEQRRLLSHAKDEIKRETYWETRRDILHKLSKRVEIGDVAEYIKYM